MEEEVYEIEAGEMKSKLPALSLEDTGILIALITTLFGAWMRLMPPAMAGFPINDGGLFYSMMGALRANSYHIPHFVHYNGLDIPFAYPPLAFYLGAGIADLFHVSDLVILQWFPAVVLIFAIPAFFLLAETLTRSRFQAGIATLLFALIPRSIMWLIMGGGLTRSLGQLFLLLAVRQLYLLFNLHTRKSMIWASIFCSLVVLTHPEASLHTAGIAVLFWAFLSYDRRGFVEAMAVGAAVLLISSIWWLPVLSSHGVAPWLAAFGTGMHNYLNFLSAFVLTFTAESLMTIVAVLGLIGIAVSLARKNYLLPTWIVMSFILERRNAPNVAIIPLCILAAAAVTEVILPALDRAESGELGIPSRSRLGAPGFLFITFIGLYSLGAMAYANTQLVALTVPQADRKAFDWVKENTPADSRFLVLTGEQDLFADAITEWFPALTGKVSNTTIQGQEWTSKRDFSSLTTSIQQMQGCLYNDEPVPCIEALAQEQNQIYDYIFIVRRIPTAPFEEVVNNMAHGERLLTKFDQLSTRYQQVYQTQEVAIYRRLP
jgi:hypothetical protein